MPRSRRQPPGYPTPTPIDSLESYPGDLPAPPNSTLVFLSSGAPNRRQHLESTMPPRQALPAALLFAAVAAVPLGAQQFPVDDPVIRGIWEEGMDRSQAHVLTQTLLDSIGPRLTGSPGFNRGADWLVHIYSQWGVQAQREDYGTWRGWDRGITHLDLREPRIRSLESTMLAWSAPSNGTVEGPAVLLPRVEGPQELEAFLGSVEGKFVLWSFAEPTCRPDSNWQEFATPQSFQRMREERDLARGEWQDRFLAARLSPTQLAARLEDAGALGIITSRWSNGWGVNKIFGAQATRIPQLDVSCEDYGLVFRLAENDQGPVLRLTAEAEDLGEVPVGNVIARIPGSEKPDEYVMLSAHFDSWDASSGATDNGTGTITMLEAIRILSEIYPRPKRTILVGHWNGEEQGLNGSRAFAHDNPDVVEGLQALFNQDNGTGRVVNISMQGLTGAAEYFGRWLSRIPGEITEHITLVTPGIPSGGGTDHAAFICHPAPGFSLGALNWEYGTYTWHTNRDTYDKVVLDDLRNNAVLTAMLVYLASEEESRVPTDQRLMPVNPQTGVQAEWPQCRDGARTSG